MENLKYYQVRLNFVLSLCRSGQFDLLQENESKIKRLLEGYRSFKDHPCYESGLINSVETFAIKTN